MREEPVIVGVPKEVKDNEYRVAPLIPGGKAPRLQFTRASSLIAGVAG
jgi:hypothetical protein